MVFTDISKFTFHFTYNKKQRPTGDAKSWEVKFSPVFIKREWLPWALKPSWPGLLGPSYVLGGTHWREKVAPQDNNKGNPRLPATKLVLNLLLSPHPHDKWVCMSFPLVSFFQAVHSIDFNLIWTDKQVGAGEYTSYMGGLVWPRVVLCNIFK